MISRAAFYGHDHEMLIEVDVDDVEDLPSFMHDEFSSALPITLYAIGCLPR